MIPVSKSVAVVNVEERVSNGQFASDAHLDADVFALLDSLEAAVTSSALQASS
jgi:hypothetical protein